MSDEYTITTRSEGLLGKIGQWGAALITDEELLEALAAHDAELRAEAESDPAKDERLVRYIAMATPLGYQSALAVVQQMTLMIQAETEARRAGVVAEEPEWGVWDRRDRVFRHVEPPTEENARREAALGGTEFEATRALPWVPIEN